MSNDEVAVLQEAAKELAPAKNLARANEHNKFVITTVSTIGTLLAGVGGVTAAIAIDRTTLYWGKVPIVPVGALLTSVFAGLAVAIALFGRRPTFTLINPERLEQVKRWYEAEVNHKKTPVRLSSFFFITAAVTAVATAALAGIFVIADPDTEPKSLASLSTSVGDKGVVTVKLGGAVDGLDEDEQLSAVVTADAPGEPNWGNHLISVSRNGDKDGSASLDSSAQVPVGSTKATARIAVKRGTDSVDTWTMDVTYPKVPEPKSDKSETAAKDSTDDSGATPAVARLLAAYLIKSGGRVPPAISRALKVLDIAAWVKGQVALRAKNELTLKQAEMLKAVLKWQRTYRRESAFKHNVGLLFVWATEHGRLPKPALVDSGVPLGNWLAQQRANYRNGTLTPKQVSLLKAVPGWTWKEG